MQAEVQLGCSLRKELTAIMDSQPWDDQLNTKLAQTAQLFITRFEKERTYPAIKQMAELMLKSIGLPSKSKEKPKDTTQPIEKKDEAKKEEEIKGLSIPIEGPKKDTSKAAEDSKKEETMKELSKEVVEKVVQENIEPISITLNKFTISTLTPNNYKFVAKSSFEIDELVEYSFFSRKEISNSNILEIYINSAKYFQRNKDVLGVQANTLNRALGCFLGGVIGDSYGSLTEFAKPKYGRTIIKDFDAKLYKEPGKGDLIINHCNLKHGQWSDDSSMAMCIADSLIDLMQFDGFDIKTRFLTWMSTGYDNAFKYDKDLKFRGSVGLGGTIHQSLISFVNKMDQVSLEDPKRANDNAIGTIMRLSPIPIFFHNNLEQCLKYSKEQSFLTHNGHEAADCAMIMAYMIYEALNLNADCKLTIKQFLDSCTDPSKENYKVLVKSLYTKTALYLLNSKQEEESMFVKDSYNANIGDRNWNWKNKTYEFSKTRVKKSKGYIGSYAMDALAMALHQIYVTDRFETMMTILVNIGGDSDSIGTVAGQIAGAFYGVQNIKQEWVNALMKWDQGEHAMRVFNMLQINPLAGYALP